MLIDLNTIEYKPNKEGYCYYPLVTSTAIGLSKFLAEQNIESCIITLQEMLEESDNEEFISCATSKHRAFWAKRKKGLRCLKCKLTPKEVNHFRNQYDKISTDVRVIPYIQEEKSLSFEEEIEAWLLSDD